LPVGLLFEQDRSAFRVDEDRLRCVDLEALFLLGALHAGIGRVRGRRERAQDERERGKPGNARAATSENGCRSDRLPCHVLALV
jgi:hypothetical protein